MEIMTNPNQEPPGAEYWTQLIRPVFEDKKVILAGGVVASQLPRAKQLRELGAASTFILATEGMGTGAAPTEEDGDWFALDPPPTNDLIEEIHASQALLGHLPQSAINALDWYDPDHNALVIGTFHQELPYVAGRKTVAYRKQEWLALDDKTVIDGLWDKVGIQRSPSQIVEVKREAILKAFNGIDRGYGVVLSGDSRDGVSGGALGTRWLHIKEDVDKTIGYFQQHCDRVRVMPFLEGIPCSVHGIVFPDYVVALRPVEMVVLRKDDTSEFFYAGTSTFWDPSSDDREYMRDIAKRAGVNLRDIVNYRGIFTIDGVMSRDGFLPTEMNTRSGAGVRPLMAGLPNFPLELLAQTLSLDTGFDYKPTQLEQFLLANADKQRGGGTWGAIAATLPHFEGKHIKLKDQDWEWSDESEADGTVIIGESPVGSFVRLTPQNTEQFVGKSFAPYAKTFWRFIDSELDSKIGNLSAPESAR